jgi:hypothetical protein
LNPGGPNLGQGTASVGMNLVLRGAVNLSGLQSPQLLFQVVAAGTSQQVANPVTISLTQQDLVALENNQPISENPVAVTIPANTSVQILVALQASQSGSEQTILQQASSPLNLAPGTSTTITVDLTPQSSPSPTPAPTNFQGPHLFLVGFQGTGSTPIAYRVDNPPTPVATATITLPSGASPESIEVNGNLDEGVIGDPSVNEVLYDFTQAQEGTSITPITVTPATAPGGNYNDAVVMQELPGTNTFFVTAINTLPLTLQSLADSTPSTLQGTQVALPQVSADTNAAEQVRVDPAFNVPGFGNINVAFVLDSDGNILALAGPFTSNPTVLASFTNGGLDGNGNQAFPLAIDYYRGTTQAADTLFVLATVNSNFVVYALSPADVASGTLGVPLFTAGFPNGILNPSPGLLQIAADVDPTSNALQGIYVAADSGSTTTLDENSVFFFPATSGTITGSPTGTALTIPSMTLKGMSVTDNSQ